jgi:RNA polymerase sigma-70 factor (family 1)
MVQAQYDIQHPKLLKQIAAGDEHAFRVLYDHWQPKLSSFIFGITKSKEITDEIVQDAFLKIWMSRETLAEINNFKAYLFLICKNQSINALKKALSQYKIIQTTSTFSDVADDSESNEHKEMVMGLIDESIHQLSPRQKEVFLLHRYEKLTYQQIADQLGIGRESVKTHLQSALKSITSHIESKIGVLFILLQYFSDRS